MTVPLQSSIEHLEAAATATASLELEYAKWCDTVAPELQADVDDDHFIQPLGLALALRGTTMRLLLHRPVLLGYIREHVGSRTNTSTVMRPHTEGKRQRVLGENKHHIAVGFSLAAVIETATTMVTLLVGGGSGPGALSAPWYQLFYGMSNKMICIFNWSELVTAMNAFMSLVAIFLIDLSKWGVFIQTSPTKILEALQSASGNFPVF